jgi:hypothetical protein
MIAYSKSSLERSRITNTAETWNKRELISNESLDKIKVSYKPDSYTPNFFVRMGLFVFTLILANAGLGLLTLITLGGSSEFSIGIRLLIYGIIAFITLEAMIKNKKLFKAGIDDALLYITLSYLISGICILVFIKNYEDNNYMYEDPTIDILFCLAWAFLFLLAAAIRYTDSLIAALSYCCLFAILFLILNRGGVIAQSIIPFAGILFSAIVYYFIKKYKNLESLIEWKEAMTIIEILSLFTFYISGNYLVVRELSQVLFEKEIPEGADIPFAMVFYVFTALIPFVYLYKSLLSKDRIMLRVGLVIFTMGILTFKYYYSLGHHEISLTLAGLTMIALVVLIMKYLKTPRHGLSSKEDWEGNSLLNTDIETIVISETFKNPGQEKGMDFGGGKFGGGGAGSSF